MYMFNMGYDLLCKFHDFVLSIISYKQLTVMDIIGINFSKYLPPKLLKITTGWTSVLTYSFTYDWHFNNILSVIHIIRVF